MSTPRVLRPGEVLPPMDSPSDSTTPAPAGQLQEPAARPARRSAGRVPPRSIRSGAPQHPSASHSKGRFQVINDFVDNIMQTLESRAALAWFTLWRNTKPTGLAKIAMSDLARRMGCSKYTARRAIKDLRDAGLLTLVARGIKGRSGSTYRLMPPELRNRA
jgi:hypothetical protein